MVFPPNKNSRRDFLRRIGAPLVLPVVGGSASWLESAGVGFAESSQSGQPSSPQQPGGLFRDVAREAGINATLTCGSKGKNWILEVYGSGCVWFDYNNDGYVDLFIVNGSTANNLLNPSRVKNLPHNCLFRNNGDGTFTDVTAKAGVGGHSWGFGAVAADYNNDGFQDLYVYNYGPNILYRNNGDGTFTDVIQQTGVAALHQVWSGGAAFGDFDKDGHLDLYVAGHIDFDLRHPPEPGQPTCTYRNKVMRACGPRGLKGAPDVLYHNNGDGTFTDVTAKAGVTDKNLSYGFAVLMEDLDGDGWPDIVVANDSGPNYFYRNKQDGTFEEVGEAAGIAYNGEGQEQANMGIAAGDYDNDGWMDLFITTYANDNKPLFHNDGKGIYTDVSYASGIGEPSIPLLGMATFFLDYNNSGLRDIFWVNGHLYPEVDRLFTDEHYHQNPQLFQNLGNGKFREVTKEVGLSAFQLGGRGAACCDYDNDGNLDIALTNMDSPPSCCATRGPPPAIGFR